MSQQIRDGDTGTELNRSGDGEKELFSVEFFLSVNPRYIEDPHISK